MRKMMLVPVSAVGETDLSTTPIVSPQETYYNSLDREMDLILNSTMDSRSKLREFSRLLSKARQMKSAIPTPKVELANSQLAAPIAPTTQPLYGTPPLSTQSTPPTFADEARLKALTARFDEFFRVRELENQYPVRGSERRGKERKSTITRRSKRGAGAPGHVPHTKQRVLQEEVVSGSDWDKLENSTAYVKASATSNPKGNPEKMKTRSASAKQDARTPSEWED